VAGAATYVSGDDGDEILEDGETWRFTTSYTVLPSDPNPLVNTGTVRGEDRDGADVTASDVHSTTISGYAPILNLINTGPISATVGDTIVYSYTVGHDVTSDGSAVSSVTIDDDVAGPATYVSGDDGDGLLVDGEIWRFTASYAVQSSDPDPLVNKATVQGADREGDTVTDSDTHSTAIRTVTFFVFLPAVHNHIVPVASDLVFDRIVVAKDSAAVIIKTRAMPR
jgi:hypothetical protein